MPARYRPHPDVISRILEREAVLLDLTSGAYFGLNETGARIWELLVEHDTEEIAARLAQEFEVPAAEASAAVDRLIQELLGKHLVEPWTEASSPRGPHAR